MGYHLPIQNLTRTSQGIDYFQTQHMISSIAFEGFEMVLTGETKNITEKNPLQIALNSTIQ